MPASGSQRPLREHLGWHGRGYLPHFDSPGAVQHVVIRTAGSLASEWLRRLDPDAGQTRRLVDAQLDKGEGEQPLADPALAQIVEDGLIARDTVICELIAWCVMPNHLHAMIGQKPGRPLGDVVKAWKMASTHAINQASGRQGKFWAPDYFDRFVRGERQFAETLAYIENNPVRAGLAATPQDWRFSSAWAGRTRA